jgi:GMP synthase (glutamine-hydrolysing)
LVEIGYYPLLTTQEGMALGPFPDHVYQWHREGCELAQGARLLATSNCGYPNQAFAFRSAIGVQFHPEITYAQVHRWTGHSNTRLNMKGARERHEHIEGHVQYAPRVQAWLDCFLGRWVAAELTIA